MRTTVELRDDLIKEAMELAGRKTMRATIELALRELVASRRRQALASMIRNPDFDFTMTLDDLEKRRATEDELLD